MSQTPFPTYHFNGPRGILNTHTNICVHTLTFFKPKKENVWWHIDKSPFWEGTKVKKGFVVEEMFGTLCTVTVNGYRLRLAPKDNSPLEILKASTNQTGLA